jgi:hypothetical protein
MKVGAVAAVGISLGGLQAVHVAAALPHLAPRLILHSCAPSSRPYPDKPVERLGAPLAFNPRFQRLTWRAVRTMTCSDAGLRAMMASLSRLPVTSWWDSWTLADRAAARSTFAMMDSAWGLWLTCIRRRLPARCIESGSCVRFHARHSSPLRVTMAESRLCTPRTSCASFRESASLTPAPPATSSGWGRRGRPSRTPFAPSWPSRPQRIHAPAPRSPPRAPDRRRLRRVRVGLGSRGGGCGRLVVRSGRLGWRRCGPSR